MPQTDRIIPLSEYCITWNNRRLLIIHFFGNKLIGAHWDVSQRRENCLSLLRYPVCTSVSMSGTKANWNSLTMRLRLAPSNSLVLLSILEKMPEKCLTDSASFKRRSPISALSVVNIPGLFDHFALCLVHMCSSSGQARPDSGRQWWL